MANFKIGRINFSETPNLLKPQQPQYDRELMWWEEEEMEKLNKQGLIEKIYYPAHFGKDIRKGDQYRVHSMEGQDIVLEVSDTQIVNSEHGEGLKITFVLNKGE